jgi:hypothetical protein
MTSAIEVPVYKSTTYKLALQMPVETTCKAVFCQNYYVGTILVTLTSCTIDLGVTMSSDLSF